MTRGGVGLPRNRRRPLGALASDRGTWMPQAKTSASHRNRNNRNKTKMTKTTKTTSFSHIHDARFSHFL